MGYHVFMALGGCLQATEQAFDVAQLKQPIAIRVADLSLIQASARDFAERL
jgi:hypothetical protein